MIPSGCGPYAGATSSKGCRSSQGPGRSPSQSATLLPYRHLEEFLRALADTSGAALTRVLRGIWVADGVPLAAVSDGLALLTGDSRSEVAIIKHYEADLFELVQAAPPQRFVESVSDSLLLRRRSGSPTLQVDLDLFEFLMRSSGGLLPGSLEREGAGRGHRHLPQSTARRAVPKRCSSWRTVVFTT